MSFGIALLKGRFETIIDQIERKEVGWEAKVLEAAQAGVTQANCLLEPVEEEL